MHAFGQQIGCDMPPDRWGGFDDGGVVTDSLDKLASMSAKSTRDRTD
jgi:hypothetical protein